MCAIGFCSVDGKKEDTGKTKNEKKIWSNDTNLFARV